MVTVDHDGPHDDDDGDTVDHVDRDPSSVDPLPSTTSTTTDPATVDHVDSRPHDVDHVDDRDPATVDPYTGPQYRRRTLLASTSTTSDPTTEPPTDPDGDPRR